jgi:hypothetical protein
VESRAIHFPSGHSVYKESKLKWSLMLKGGNRRTVTNDWRDIIPTKDNSIKRQVSKKRNPTRISLKAIILA